MRAAPNMSLCLSAFRTERKTEEALVLLLIKFVTGNVCVFGAHERLLCATVEF